MTDIQKRAKELLPFVKALAQGKTIEESRKHGAHYRDWKVKNNLVFGVYGGTKYRIKRCLNEKKEITIDIPKKYWVKEMNKLERILLVILLSVMLCFNIITQIELNNLKIDVKLNYKK